MKPILFVPVLTFAATVASAQTPPPSVVVSADKPAYRHSAADKPATAAVTLEVKNESGAAVSLTFPTGQRYDFVLYDKCGHTVARWSTERMFTMAFGYVKLAAGETRKFSDTLVLAADGQNLPAGDYELEGVLSSAPPHASKRIKLKVAF
jgi:hypothetical protein